MSIHLDQYDYRFDQEKNLWRKSYASGTAEVFRGLSADWCEVWEPGVMPESTINAEPELGPFFAYVWNGAS